MKKILHLYTELNIACGISKTIFLLLKNLDNVFEQEVICLGGDGLSRFYSIDKIPLVLNYNRYTIRGTLSIIFFLIKYCKKNKIEIIHSHHRYFDLITSLIKYFTKTKTIMSVHSKVYGKKIISYKSDILIACSNSIKTHLINYFKVDSNRIRFISNFFDPTDIILDGDLEKMKLQLNLPSRAFLIGFFGRIDYQEKGLDILLKAFRDLSKANNNLHLIIVGNGPEKDSALNFITLHNLNAHVIEAQTRIFKYYAISNLVVLPSRVEPFGLVILECGAMRKPFIGSNVDGIPEIIKDGINGLLFKKNDIDELKNCLMRLVDDKKLTNKLANNLHYDVVDNYSTRNIIPKYISLYDALDAK